MVIAALKNGSLCDLAADQSQRCYLLSEAPLLGSKHSLEFLGLAPTKKGRQQSEPPNLPSMSLFGLLNPTCWRYVRVQRRPARRVVLQRASDRLQMEATQEWSHPLDKAHQLRVVVSGACMPFLLEEFPRRLSDGRVRRDATATTVIEGTRERRALIVERVVIDESAVGALLEARERHADALNPIISAPSEAPHSSIVEELRADARQRRRLTAWRLIGVNVLVLLLNALVAARGVYLWSVLQRLRVVEWITRLRPHVQPTFHAMRVINWVTLPVRWPLRRLGARRAAAAARLRT